MKQHLKIACAAMGLGFALASGASFGQCVPYTISAAPAEAGEGAFLTFRVFRTGDPGQAASVQYWTAPLTATSADFEHQSGTLTFYPNEVMKTVTVRAKYDTVSEPPESFQLVLAGPGTQPPLTNGTGVIVSSVSPSAPPVGIPSVPPVGIPSVPPVGIPSVPRLPTVTPPGLPDPTLPGVPAPRPPQPPSPCKGSSYCQ